MQIESVYSVTKWDWRIALIEWFLGWPSTKYERLHCAYLGDKGLNIPCFVSLGVEQKVICSSVAAKGKLLYQMYQVLRENSLDLMMSIRKQFASLCSFSSVTFLWKVNTISLISPGHSYLLTKFIPWLVKLRWISTSKPMKTTSYIDECSTMIEINPSEIDRSYLDRLDRRWWYMP